MSAVTGLDVPATTIDLLDRAVAARPDAAALVCGAVRLTYAELAHAVDAIADALGDVRGRPVAIVLGNGTPICVAVLAAQRAGAIACALNPDYTPHELQPILTDAAPAALICDEQRIDRLAMLVPGARLLPVGQDCSRRILERPRPAPLPPVDPAAHAVLQFTGGTTGRPKGVLLTHRAVVTNVLQRELRLPTVHGDEVIVSAMPLFHSFATAMGLHLALHAAGTLVILPRYRPDWVVDAVERHRATRLPAGPAMFHSLLGFDGLSRERLATLRCAYSGSAALPEITLQRWEAATGVPIYEGYGQTEAGPVLTYCGPGMAARPGWVGPAVDGTEIRIVDPATGARVDDGGTGEVIARGPQVMTGYLGRPEETKAALRDGWLHTGDIGRLDADGWLRIEDRLKDMVIVGGYNVYPREVDEVLAACPGVTEAAAVGVPDPYRGEVIHALVAGDADDPTLAAHCEARLARYKRPVAYHRVEALPRTGVGKLDRAAARAVALGRMREAVVVG